MEKGNKLDTRNLRLKSLKEETIVEESFSDEMKYADSSEQDEEIK